MPSVAASQSRQRLEINGVHTSPQTAPEGIIKKLVCLNGLPTVPEGLTKIATFYQTFSFKIIIFRRLRPFGSLYTSVLMHPFTLNSRKRLLRVFNPSLVWSTRSKSVLVTSHPFDNFTNSLSKIRAVNVSRLPGICSSSNLVCL